MHSGTLSLLAAAGLVLLVPVHATADDAPATTDAGVAPAVAPAEPVAVKAAPAPVAAVATSPATAAATPAADPGRGAIDAAIAEIALWNSIKNSDNVADYALYLKRYPDGSFADLAQFRVRELETRRMVAEATARWQQIKDGEDLEAFEDFLRRYGQSPFAAEAEQKAQTLRPLTLTVHYLRRDQVLLGWKIRHELSQTTVPFDRIDDDGAIALLSVKAKLAARRSGFVLLHRGQVEECAGTREIRWDRPVSIWLLEQDCGVYTSLEQAQKAMAERVVPKGARRLHYLRKDGQEANWSLILRGDGLLGGLWSLGKKDELALTRRDRWGAWADWVEQEGQGTATLVLQLSSLRDEKEVCPQPLRWPAEAGKEAWYVAGTCTLVFSLDEALAARRKALGTP